MSEATDTTKVSFRKNGDLSVTEDDKLVVIAHYDRKTGHLEYASKDYQTRYGSEITVRISTVAKGTQPSANVIRSFGIQGVERPDLKGAPKCPKKGELGDAGEDFVAWMLKWDMPQAIVRYGIYCDENGEPIKKKVRRVYENTFDNRQGKRRDAKMEPEIGQSLEKGPVFREQIEDVTEGYIAVRATALTFTPGEVIGGWQPSEEEPTFVGEGEDSE